eukprot:Nk52_evm66s352 gene=Nk52_evmTU66s352
MANNSDTEVCEPDDKEQKAFTCSSGTYCCGDRCCLSLYRFWWLWIVAGVSVIGGIVFCIYMRRKRIHRRRGRPRVSRSSAQREEVIGVVDVQEPKPAYIVVPTYVYDEYGNIIATEEYTAGDGPPPYSELAEESLPSSSQTTQPNVLYPFRNSGAS